jgi:predicted permease
MRLLDSLRLRIATLFRRSRMNAEIEDELRSHIQFYADDLERSGLPRAEAERLARIRFGGHARFKEECREAFFGNFIEILVRDVRFGIRVLRKSPGFTIVAILTLAVAIGANALVFGVLDALILRPLNVPQPDSLYAIEHGSKNSPSQSYPDYLDLRDRNSSFEDLAGFTVAQVGLDAGQNPTRVWTEEVSGNYFDALGIRPYLGRFIHASDEHGPNSVPYIVLSYAYWHTYFQNDRGVLGHVVQLNKHVFTVVGVAPPEFHGTLLFISPDIFVPVVDEEQIEGRTVLNVRASNWSFMVIGHLKAGVTPGQAIADLNSIGSYLEKTYPNDEAQMTFSLARPGLFGDFFGRPVRAFMTGLMLLAGLILLAACANLGGLFAARAADRSRETALRLALGSSPSRILRQLFTEAILISLAGGAVGLFGSVVLLRELSMWQPFPTFPLNVPVKPDASVYGVALLLTLASGFLFGAVPVRQILRTDPYQVIKSGSRATAGRRVTVREVLLGVQVAICALLVTSSLVAVRGLARSLHSNFGFEPQNAMLMWTVLATAGYTGDMVAPMQKRMIEAMQTIPGVTSVGLIHIYPPLVGGGGVQSFVYSDETTDLRPSRAAAEPFLYVTSPEYFRAAGTALWAGRDFTWHDDQNSPRVAVVNGEFARRLFGSPANAMGRYYKNQDGTRIQVVGIAEDGKYANVAEDPKPATFVPILQAPPTASSESYLVVRSERDPQQLAAAMQAKLRGLDSGLPSSIQTWDRALDFALFPSRVATVSLGVLGAMGAILSITGIFGMAAYSVSKRKRELGIRMALGAQRMEVLQAALGRALKLLAVGSAAGLILGILASRVLASIVYQATPRDPLVLGGVVLAMFLLGLLATWIPAQRALSLDPAKLLREE